MTPPAAIERLPDGTGAAVARYFGLTPSPTDDPTACTRRRDALAAIHESADVAAMLDDRLAADGLPTAERKRLQRLRGNEHRRVKHHAREALAAGAAPADITAAKTPRGRR